MDKTKKKALWAQYDWQRGTGLMCLDVESRCKMTTTSLFKAIEPYEVY